MPNQKVTLVVLLYLLRLTRKTSLRKYLVMAFGESYVDRLYLP